MKYKLYKIEVPFNYNSLSYFPEEAQDAINEVTAQIRPVKIADKGMKFVYCNTDRKDGRMGWYADEGYGLFREGNCGFSKMKAYWAERHLTDPGEEDDD